MGMKILIVEDDPTQRELLATLLKRDGPYDILYADNGRVALNLLEKNFSIIRLVIMDQEMPVMTGLEALEVIHDSYPDLPVIMLTGNHTTENIVKAMRLGAIDFMTKPYEPRRLAVTVQNAIKMASLHKEVTRLRRTEEGVVRFTNLIGCDEGLSDVVKTGRKAAASNIPVLITGETGVGKEVFARAIHGESARSGSPFIAINCGAIPENLVESTLFGHEKGAFTGASTKTIGKFREAQGGTIFLDEISELPKESQVKLLRVLQQKEIEPVGAGQTVPVNVRILSATNRDLQKEVKAGRFREDLFFRLNVLQITLPPLRERKQDILALAQYFLDRYCVTTKTHTKVFSDSVLNSLAEREWYGNVRELENAVHRAVVMSESDVINMFDFSWIHDTPEITYKPLPPTRHFYTSGYDRLKTIAEHEAEAIRYAINYYNQDIEKAATALGLAKSTLYRKIKEGILTRIKF